MQKFITLFFLFLGLLSYQAGVAKVWRVNNTTGVSADFTDLSTAVASASVSKGDTIYVEGSGTSYSAPTITKKLFIIGPGYFLTGNPANANTEANPDTAYVPYVICAAGSAGSVIAGLWLPSGVYLQDSSVTLERNYMGSTITLGYSGTNNTIKNDTIRQNYITSYINAYNTSIVVQNLLVYNNIMVGISLSNLTTTPSGYLINNDLGAIYLGGAQVQVANFVLQNNILYSPNFGSFVNSNVYFNNISTNNTIPAGNANVNNVTWTTVYIAGQFAGAAQGSSQPYPQDSAFVLATGSPAKSAGALNGATVDCGAFGGPAPYVLSGMPAGIPSIYALTAPTQVNSGTSSINVTISAASH